MPVVLLADHEVGVLEATPNWKLVSILPSVGIMPFLTDAAAIVRSHLTIIQPIPLNFLSLFFHNLLQPYNVMPNHPSADT